MGRSKWSETKYKNLKIYKPIKSQMKDNKKFNGLVAFLGNINSSEKYLDHALSHAKNEQCIKELQDAKRKLLMGKMLEKIYA